MQSMLTPNYFAALADPTRFQIVTMLAQRGRLAVGEIGREFSISAPAISQHLKVLKEAAVVVMEVQAQQRIYAINPEGISDVEQWVNGIKQFWNQRLDALDILLQEEITKQAPRSMQKKLSKQTKPTKPKTKSPSIISARKKHAE